MAQVGDLYDQIIAQVIEDSRELFSNEGFDTNVLAELKKLWKEKLVASGAVAQHGGMGGSAAAAGRVPLGAPDGGRFAGMPFPSQMPGAQWNGQPPASLPGMHAPYGAAGIRVRNEGLPQTDGAAEHDFMDVESSSQDSRRPKRGDVVTLTMEIPQGGEPAETVLSIEQVDGAGAGPQKKQKTGDGASADYGDDDLDDDDPGDDSELGSDDDDSDEEPETSNLVLCQYDKVSRTKTKWKAALKDGMMQANGHDYVFKKATGEMNFSK